MNQEQTRTIKTIYSGRREYISCPLHAVYEDFIGKALERFGIPAEFRNFTQFTNDFMDFFDKRTFEHFLLLHPLPNVSFFIRVDYIGLLRTLSDDTRRSMVKLLTSSKRRADLNRSYGIPAMGEERKSTTARRKCLFDDAKAEVPLCKRRCMRSGRRRSFLPPSARRSIRI